MAENLRPISTATAHTGTTMASPNSPRANPSPIILKSFKSSTSLKTNEKERGGGEVPLDYKLPSLIAQAHEGWIKACDSGTVATTVLASVAVSVWIHLEEKLKGDSPPPIEPWQSALLLSVAYMGVIANCSATITSFLIIDRFVELPLSAAKRIRAVGTHHDGSIIELFNLYLDWKMWGTFKAYWILNVTLGILLIFAEFFIYLWVWEPQLSVKIVVTVFTAFGLCSFVAYYGEAAAHAARERMKSHEEEKEKNQMNQAEKGTNDTTQPLISVVGS